MSLHMQIKYERQFAVQHPTYQQTLSCCPVAVPNTAGKFNTVIKKSSIWFSANTETHWKTSVMIGMFSLKALSNFHIKNETFD